MKTKLITFIRFFILTLALCILTGNSANANQPEPLKPIQSAFNPKTATWDISWPGRVSQYDLVYLSPPVDPMQGIPLGNGEVGVLFWCEDSKIIAVVNKSDLWDDAKFGPFHNWDGAEEDLSTTQRHACRIVIDFRLPVFNTLYLSGFKAKLNLADGSLSLEGESAFGKVSLKAFVDHQTGLLFYEVKSDLNENIPVEIAVERFGSRTFSHWYHQINRDATIGLSGSEAIADQNGAYISQKLASGTFGVGGSVIQKNNLNVDFFESQAIEERRKLGYFQLGPNWKNKILHYENHEYFYGQINFIFNLLGEDVENFNLFEKYGDKLFILYKSDIEREDHLLQTALLSIDNYTINISGNKYSFCKSDRGSLRVRNDNWRKVFDDGEKLIILKSLLDYDDDLSHLVARPIKKNDWSAYFIEFPNAITYCADRYFDIYSALDIRLLKASTYSGKHTDLYLYILYEKLRNINFKKIEVKHVDVNYFRTESSFPRLEISRTENDQANIFLSVNYHQRLEENMHGFEINPLSILDTYNLDNYFTDFKKADSGSWYIIIPNFHKIDDVISKVVEAITNIINHSWKPD